MRLIKSLAVVVVLLCAGAVMAADFSGNYSGDLAGVPMTLALQQRGSALRGVMKIGSSEATRLRGTVSADKAHGAVANAKGSGGFEARLDGDALSLEVTTGNPSTAKVLALKFRRDGVPQRPAVPAR